jgi:two-component system, OmpR family, KDP operon response regulator KdpE
VSENASTPPARILVVDDEPQIRRFLEISLRSQGYAVDEAATGREGLEWLATRGAELVVLDLGLPDMEGHDVLRELRQWSRVPVIVLSVRASEAEKVRALDGGANDYVTKPFGIQELMARVRGLLRDQAAPQDSPPVFDDGRLRVDLPRRLVTFAGEPVRLSRKEFAVLAMLVQHAGRVVTQQHLLREIWGPGHQEDTHYLRIVVAKIRHKLGGDPTGPRYVLTEPGVGYRFDGEPQGLDG